MSAKPIPDGYAGALPDLVVRGAAEAIDFYTRVFGATEIMRLADPAGRIAHAEIRINGSVVMIAEENPEWGNRGPRSLGGSPVLLHLYVEDADAVARAAVAAGARVLIPIADQFYGDRSGRIEDPFGHLWILSTRREDLSAEEIRRRFEAFAKGQGG